MELLNLSTELLLAIFKYLSIQDLCNVRATCHRFHTVVDKWDHVILSFECPLVTNQKNELFLTKCRFKLSTLEKIRISKNWKAGRYVERSILYAKKKYLPRIQADDEFLWYSRGPAVFCFERTSNRGTKHVNIGMPKAVIQGGSVSDIGNFCVKKNLLVSGQRDASIWMVDLKTQNIVFNISDCHDSDILNIDYSESTELLITGSRDCSFKLWKIDPESENMVTETAQEHTADRVLKVALLQKTSLLAVGTSGNENVNSLFIYDLERLTKLTELPSTLRGLGVLDVRWESPSVIWSCGYDARLKKWDLRSGQLVTNLLDCHAATLYCMDYDHVNTIMAGTAMHGRVILWDVRQNKPVQLFFMESCRSIRHGRSSPIYGLQFDSEFLFTATDQNLNLLNFSKTETTAKDYSSFVNVKYL